jgi:hypothetical protein
VPNMVERYVIHDPDRGWFAHWSWKGGRKHARWCATRNNLNLFRFFSDHPSAVATLAELHRLGATRAGSRRFRNSYGPPLSMFLTDFSKRAARNATEPMRRKR